MFREVKPLNRYNFKTLCSDKYCKIYTTYYIKIHIAYLGPLIISLLACSGRDDGNKFRRNVHTDV